MSMTVDCVWSSDALRSAVDAYVQRIIGMQAASLDLAPSPWSTQGVGHMNFALSWRVDVGGAVGVERG